MSIARSVAFFASSADSGGCRRGGVGAGASASLAGVPDAADAADAGEPADAADAGDAPDAPLTGDACAGEAGCAAEAVDDEDVAVADGTSDAATAGRATRTGIRTAAASQTYVATARERQRGLGNRRVRSESIMRSKPSADPAAARGERRICRASHRHAGHTHVPGADASSRWSRSHCNAFGQWRLMSRQVFHSTRADTNRQGRTPGFAVVLRFVTPRFNSLPHATCACATRVYFEMVSSAMPFVRGPMNPIAAITIAIAPAMNANTPNVPKPFSTAAITNDEKIAEKRLHE